MRQLLKAGMLWSLMMMTACDGARDRQPVPVRSEESRTGPREASGPVAWRIFRLSQFAQPTTAAISQRRDGGGTALVATAQRTIEVEFRSRCPALKFQGDVTTAVRIALTEMVCRGRRAKVLIMPIAQMKRHLRQDLVDRSEDELRRPNADRRPLPGVSRRHP